MTAVVLSLVAVVLLVLVVVALGMRSMNSRESSLPPERLKEMAEKEGNTQIRSTDEFAAHEPRMNNFSPEFSTIDPHKQPKPVRTGQRGKRGVDEWGTADDDDEDFWANIRSEAEEGGFGAGGTVAARKGASRPVEREPVHPDPNAATVQAPLPSRAPRPAPEPAAAALGNLVEPIREHVREPVRSAPTAADMADQRTVTFAAPTPDIMSILGTGSRPVAPPPRPVAPPMSSGSFPSVHAASSGSFPVVPPAPLHGAPTSDPFPAYGGGQDPRQSSWQSNHTSNPDPSPATTSGSWAAASHDILDDPAPAGTPSGSWPAFDAAYTTAPRETYSPSYEVSSGWAAIDDADQITGPTPAASTQTAPGRAVSAYDDPLAAPGHQSYGYDPDRYAPPAAAAAQAAQAAWPEPPAGGSNASWPSYGELYPPTEAGAAAAQEQRGGHHRSTPEQDYPDYYR